jgi:hypothetical protein
VIGVGVVTGNFEWRAIGKYRIFDRPVLSWKRDWNERFEISAINFALMIQQKISSGSVAVKVGSGMGLEIELIVIGNSRIFDHRIVS